MMDYQKLIDSETWGFIRASGKWQGDGTPEGERAAYDAMARAFHHGHPPGINTSDSHIGTVPVRRYGPGAGVTVAYFHGGGFLLGGLESHDDICAEICAATGFRVVSADYRLSPEHLHPAALDDCLAVVRALLAEAGPVMLAGDSAGANLAAAVAHRMRGAFCGMVLIYPGLGGDTDAGSYIAHADAPMLTRADVLAFTGLRFGGTAPLGDPSAAPLQDVDFSGLPPTVAFAAECDPLADDATAYATRITAAGGRAQAVVEPGLVHGYLRARHSVTRAQASFARITGAIAALGRGNWPAV